MKSGETFPAKGKVCIKELTVQLGRWPKDAHRYFYPLLLWVE